VVTLLFEYIYRKLRFLARSIKTHGTKGGGSAANDNESADNLSANLKDNLQKLKSKMENSSDFKVHSLLVGSDGRCGAVVFIDGLIDNLLLTNSVLRPIKEWEDGEEAQGDLIAALEKEVLCASTAEKAKTMQEVMAGYL
jgi:hypothetical protein